MLAASALTGVAALSLDGSRNHPFTMGVRPEITGFPVVVFRPNHVSRIAFDVMPNGSPVEDTDNGVAWSDICNADLIANHNAPVSCVRSGAFLSKAVIGQRSFNGAPHVPLIIVQGGKTRLVIDDGVIDIIGELRINGRPVN